MNLTYTFSDKTKKVCFALMGIGLISMIALFITDKGPDGAVDYKHTRLWANLLLNGTFFMGIALVATFFMALQYAAEAAYAVTVKRVYEAISEYLVYGVVIVLLILLLGRFGVHDLYKWMDQSVYDKSSPKFDHIINGKHGFFVDWFFWLRTLVFMGLWVWFQKGFRKRSIEEDLTDGISIHNKNIKKGALFLLLFGVTSSTESWDLLMSLDAHWFSTMYGWYTFAGWWISAMVMITLTTLYLKSKGYLENVNENHIHDLGKWCFAVSFLWSYLFFMQFMLIWYTNIPEEVSYFWDRIHQFGYRGLFWGVFFINFVFPMVMLIARDTKRNPKYLTFVGTIILIGHWLDTYLNVMPPTVGKNWHLSIFSSGIMEIGIALGFLGLFLFVVHSALAKVPLMVKHHPYLDESIHLHT